MAEEAVQCESTYCREGKAEKQRKVHLSVRSLCLCEQIEQLHGQKDNAHKQAVYGNTGVGKWASTLLLSCT